MSFDKKKTAIRLLLFVFITAGVFLLVKNDYMLYEDPIAKVTSVEESLAKTERGFDGDHEYEESYYDQTITARLMNGSHKGEAVTFENTYAQSTVYDTNYREGDDVFIDSLTEDGGSLTGKAAGVKRDHLAALVLCLLFGLFLLIDGKRGLLTIFSLALNMVVFYYMLVLYNKGTDMLILAVPMVIFFTAMLLFFMYGFGRRTVLSFVATMVTVLITVGVATLALNFSDVDYTFMEYLEQPFDPDDARRIFIAELLIGSLGAIMDVVVTVVMTVDQIALHSPETSRKSLVASCRNVGDDVIGTMISIMFFTNIAASLPFFLLAMRNGFAVVTILKYHVFFELARFLCGSIGVVLAIPVSAALSIWYYKRKKVKSC